ncbi:HAMP domain-containing protein [Asanoa ferruginea]|uniref:histidine kinase n=1 Tax=Asanoa ferruginea TaxID=53367 RepID=A0A3D9ZEJ4_9ACTN|nr:HAMP domain-containing sensor histidine kinase [Asanoa ferruginea]REF95289.1 HAMP domain-containing protein [Asanoa ferruginea]GIF48378.1 hypothetical protein Afe04nite_29170 [Asanoa ferruginea]
MSIRARVTLFGVAVVAVIYTVVAVLIYLLLSYGFAEDQDQLLAERASAAVSGLAELPGDALVARPPLTPVDAVATGEAVVVVLDGAGAVLSSTGHIGAGPPGVPPTLLAAASRAGFVVATVPVSGVDTRVRVVPWSRPDLGRAGYVVAAQPIRAIQVQSRGMIVVLAAVGFLGLVAAFAATWFAVGRALRPLRVLASLADSVGGSEDLTRRLPAVRQRDDLGRLTTSFNTMMGRLESAYRRMESALSAQRRFTADASHELRTPLTTIRGNVGFLRTHPAARPDDREAALDDLVAESARMARLLDDLLLLARSDGGVALSTSPVDLLEVATSVCRQASASSSGASVVVAGDRDARVLEGGDPAASAVVAGDRDARALEGGDPAASAVVAGDRDARASEGSDPSASAVVAGDRDPRVVVGSQPAASAVVGSEPAVSAVVVGDPAARVVVAGDPDALRRLVWILVDNALRHGAGAVTVEVSRSDSGARLTVADEGPGVPADLTDAVFERFFRGDPARGPGGGVGLGLAIARSVVTTHGGTISVAGAVFTVTLPLSSNS